MSRSVIYKHTNLALGEGQCGGDVNISLGECNAFTLGRQDFAYGRTSNRVHRDGHVFLPNVVQNEPSVMEAQVPAGLVMGLVTYTVSVRPQHVP